MNKNSQAAAFTEASVPVPGAFEPVEDVGASGVVDLVEWMSVGLLHGHRVAAETPDGGAG